MALSVAASRELRKGALIVSLSQDKPIIYALTTLSVSLFPRHRFIFKIAIRNRNHCKNKQLLHRRKRCDSSFAYAKEAKRFSNMLFLFPQMGIFNLGLPRIQDRHRWKRHVR